MKKRFSASLLILFLFGCQVNSINKLPEPTSLPTPLPSSPPPEQKPGVYPTPTPFPTSYPQGYNGIYGISTNNYSKDWSSNLQSSLTFGNGGFGFVTLAKYNENAMLHNKFILNTFDKNGKEEIKDLELDDKYYSGDYITADIANNQNGDIVIASTIVESSFLSLKFFEKSTNKYSIKLPLEKGSKLKSLSLYVNKYQEAVLSYTYTSENSSKFYFVVNKFDKNGKILLDDKTDIKSDFSGNLSFVKIDKDGNTFAFWDYLGSISVKIFQPDGHLINYKKDFITNVRGLPRADYDAPNYNVILDKDNNLTVLWIVFDPALKGFSANIQKFSKNLTEVTAKKVVKIDPHEYLNLNKVPTITEDENGNILIYPDPGLNNLIFLDKELNLINTNQKLIDAVKSPESRDNKIISFTSDGNILLSYKDAEDIYYKRFTKDGDLIINP